jgi:hypothetical protein
LNSRLKGNPNNKEKLTKINEFLEKNILDKELKNTPLVLLFLTQLEVDKSKEINEFD